MKGHVTRDDQPLLGQPDRDVARAVRRAEAYYVDQSPYAHLDTFDELATRNAGRVYEQMEFE